MNSEILSKPSGDPWIGQIPESWDTIRCKFLLSPVGGCIPENFESCEDGFDYYKVDDLNRVGEKLVLNESSTKIPGEKVRPIPSPCILIPKRGAAIFTNKVTISERDCYFDSNVMGLLPLKRIDIQFAALCLLARGLSDIADVSTIPQINNKHINELIFPLPSLKEQEKIATFLDRKTAAIDTLIAKKQRLIELLEEKRAALINQAVTKGLNRDVPMKDSGIPWIGEIPEYWTVSKPKFLTKRIVDGTHHTPEYVDEGVPFLTVKNLTAGFGIDFSDVRYVTKEAHVELCKRANPEVGDLLVTKDGTLGVVRVIEDERDFSIFVSLALVKPIHKKIDPYFLRYVLESKTVFDQFQAWKAGSALKHIHLVDLSNVLIPLPPIGEQKKIAAELKIRINHYQLTEERVFKQIEKLQEYRQSLITAAVTGKLEVPVDERA